MNDDHKSPKTTDEQDAPRPERMVTPQEEAGQDIAELEDPPQAEEGRCVALTPAPRATPLPQAGEGQPRAACPRQGEVRVQR